MELFKGRTAEIFMSNATKLIWMERHAAHSALIQEEKFHAPGTALLITAAAR